MKYNTAEVATLQSDYLGFIFYDKSPRNFTGEIPDLPEGIKKVGVFVDATMDNVLGKIEKYSLDSVQLHGSESPQYCFELKRHFELNKKSNKEISQLQSSFRNDKRLEIIKVFSIKDEFDFSILEPYEAIVDYYLFDTKGKLPGGNGYAFDWNVLKNYPSTKPYFLSGGIGLGEVELIESFLKTNTAKYCYAIDVNSKFEIKPGLKDTEQLKKFKSQI